MERELEELQAQRSAILDQIGKIHAELMQREDAYMRMHREVFWDKRETKDYFRLLDQLRKDLDPVRSRIWDLQSQILESEKNKQKNLNYP